jgi:hypothetical protein
VFISGLLMVETVSFAAVLSVGPTRRAVKETMLLTVSFVKRCCLFNFIFLQTKILPALKVQLFSKFKKQTDY